MNISIYSREAAEQMIAAGRFPQNTAVISFFDPEIRRTDEAYAHVDYSKVCKDVYYCELDDLDSDDLPELTYDTFFPDAAQIAEFVYAAVHRGQAIICQCDYGQSRSAGCAAAILEHFDHTGIRIFADYRYYPNQIVYHKLSDALERQKRYSENRRYYAANAAFIASQLEKLHLPESLLSGYQLESGNSAADFKYATEQCLEARNMLYHSPEEIINALLTNGQPVYASFRVTNPHYMYDSRLWDAYAVFTVFRYGCEEIPVQIWFSKYRSSIVRPHARNAAAKREYRFPISRFRSMDFFGRLSWDGKRKLIDAVPLVITNIQ